MKFFIIDTRNGLKWKQNIDYQVTVIREIR